MKELKTKFKDLIDSHRTEVSDLVRTHGQESIGTIHVEDMFRGMRNLPLLYTETSKIHPEKGILYRNKTLSEVRELLSLENKEPFAESLFWFLLTGECPSYDEAHMLRLELLSRAHVPHHVFNAINAMPHNARPMSQYCVGMLSLTTISNFQDKYDLGMTKDEYWAVAFDDALQLIANSIQIAAYVYQRNYTQHEYIVPNHKLDWAGNLAHMMGFENEEIYDLMRLYIFLHADHEGGNISAHTAHLVGSSLANIYYSYTAGLLGLSGPLHGYANQSVVKWIQNMQEHFSTDEPSILQIKEFAEMTLQQKKVVPGFGHASLQNIDPRFTMFFTFAKKHHPSPAHNSLLRIVEDMTTVIPPLLQKTGKVRNPYQNIDAISGALLNHYGIKEHGFYTVLFGVARVIGVAAQYIINRALCMPIERPSSHNFKSLQELMKKTTQK